MKRRIKESRRLAGSFRIDIHLERFVTDYRLWKMATEGKASSPTPLTISRALAKGLPAVMVSNNGVTSFAPAVWKIRLMARGFAR